MPELPEVETTKNAILPFKGKTLKRIIVNNPSLRWPIDEKAINSASAAAVRGVPTVVVYKKGVEVARKVGGLPEQQMRDFLKENL